MLGRPVQGLRDSLQRSTDSWSLYRWIGSEQGRKAWGPMRYHPRAQMEEDRRKAVLDRVDSTSLGRLSEPISP